MLRHKPKLLRTQYGYSVLHTLSENVYPQFRIMLCIYNCSGVQSVGSSEGLTEFYYYYYYNSYYTKPCVCVRVHACAPVSELCLVNPNL